MESVKSFKPFFFFIFCQGHNFQPIRMKFLPLNAII